MHPLVKWLLQAGAVATALVAVASAWQLFGGDTLAWSSDVKRLDRKQAEVAVEVYTTKRNSLILNAPPQTANVQTQRLHEEALHDANRQLKQAEDRKIELSK